MLSWSLGRGEVDARDAPVQRHQHSIQCSDWVSFCRRCPKHMSPTRHALHHPIREQASSANQNLYFLADKSQHETRPRCALVYANSQSHGVRGRCNPLYIFSIFIRYIPLRTGSRNNVTFYLRARTHLMNTMELPIPVTVSPTGDHSK